MCSPCLHRGQAGRPCSLNRRPPGGKGLSKGHLTGSSSSTWSGVASKARAPDSRSRLVVCPKQLRQAETTCTVCQPQPVSSDLPHSRKHHAGKIERVAANDISHFQHALGVGYRRTSKLVHSRDLHSPQAAVRHVHHTLAGSHIQQLRTSPQCLAPAANLLASRVDEGR